MYDQESIDEHHDGDNVVYEGLRLKHKPASITKRVMAYCIDTAIVTSGMYVVVPLLAILFGFTAVALKSFEKTIGEGITSGAGMAVIAILVFVIILLVVCYDFYFVYFEFNKGTTPGKKIFGLKVISLDGTRLTIGQCVTRDLLRLVDCLMIFPGLLSIALTEKRRRLGDLMAGTIVVHSEEREEEQDFRYITKADYNFLRDLLKPKEPPQDKRKEFLTFSHDCFVLCKRNFDPKAHDAYVQQALNNFTAPDLKLDPRTVVLFHAEHCFQLQRNQQRDK